MTSLTTQAAREITCRKLNAEDAEAYRELRIKAITEDDRRGFYINPEEELAQNLDDWRAVCTETCDRARFGAFDKNQKLVGSMAVALWEKDSKQQTAYFRAAYILPEHRHSDVAKGLFVCLYTWSKNHGCEKAVYAIRQDNTRWIENQSKHGARIIGEEPLRFADGTIAQACWLEKTLDNEQKTVCAEFGKTTGTATHTTHPMLS